MFVAMRTRAQQDQQSYICLLLWSLLRVFASILVLLFGNGLKSDLQSRLARLSQKLQQ